MRMFFVEHTTEDSTSLSQFIVAETWRDAVALWQQYWSNDNMGGEFIEPDQIPDYVMEVPHEELLIKQARVISWDHASIARRGIYEEKSK